MKIAHILNPVNVSEESDLFQAQPVTFRSMINARNISRYKEHIGLYAVGYDEDIKIVPEEFSILPNLSKSVLDCSSSLKGRKLPLIGDILLSVLKLDYDYIIYTNVDIAVQPYFYDFVFDYMVNNSSNSLIINRRVINSLDTYVNMSSEVGKDHPGYDCFVFKKEFINKFIFGNVCIGANWIGRAFIANLVALSDEVIVMKDRHLTFHIGDDGAWLTNRFNEFDEFNKSEVYKILAKLREMTSDETKNALFDEIQLFMDNWGVNTKKKVSLLNKIRFRLAMIIKPS